MERQQLSAQGIARYGAIENTMEGYFNVDEAAEQLHLSGRQAFRLKRKLKERGIEGLIHGNRGRVSPRRVKDYPRDMIDYLYGGKYGGLDISHFRGMGEDREGVTICRETVRASRL